MKRIRGFRKVAAVLLSAALLLGVMAVPAMAATGLVGYVNGDVYTNEYFGIQFDLPEGFQYYSDEELAAESGVDVSLYEDRDDAQAESAGMWYDMYIEDGTGTNINASVAQMTAVDKLYLSANSLEDYLLDMIPSMEEALQEQGFSLADYGIIEDYSFPTDDEYACLYMEESYRGVNMYQKQIYILKDDYAYIITASGLSEDDLDEILEHYTSLEGDSSDSDLEDVLNQLQELLDKANQE